MSVSTPRILYCTVDSFSNSVDVNFHKYINSIQTALPTGTWKGLGLKSRLKTTMIHGQLSSRENRDLVKFVASLITIDAYVDSLIVCNFAHFVLIFPESGNSGKDYTDDRMYLAK